MNRRAYLVLSAGLAGVAVWAIFGSKVGRSPMLPDPSPSTSADSEGLLYEGGGGVELLEARTPLDVERKEESEPIADLSRFFQKMPSVPYEHKFSVTGHPPAWEIIEPTFRSLMLSNQCDSFEEYFSKWKRQQTVDPMSYFRLSNKHPAYPQIRELVEVAEHEGELALEQWAKASLVYREKVWEKGLYQKVNLAYNAELPSMNANGALYKAHGWAIAFTWDLNVDLEYERCREEYSDIRSRLAQDIGSLIGRSF